MSKESTICERIIFLSEQIMLLKKLNEKEKLLKFVYSRLNNPPPSHIFKKEIIEENIRSIEELTNDIQKLIKPLLKGITFDIKANIVFSSRDIYRGYIELYDPSGKEYILFLRPFMNGIVNIEEGSLVLNDAHQVSRVIDEMKPLKRDSKAKTLLDALINQK